MPGTPEEWFKKMREEADGQSEGKPVKREKRPKEKATDEFPPKKTTALDHVRSWEQSQEERGDRFRRFAENRGKAPDRNS